MRSPHTSRTALIVAVVATLAAACGGGDDDAVPNTVAPPSADAESAAADEGGSGGATEEPGGGGAGAASFAIDGTTYRWDQVSCSAVRVVDGVTQPGAILQSGAIEATTGAFMSFVIESADGAWAFSINDGGTGESWTVAGASVSESGNTYEATGEAFSTSNATPRPFELTITCP